MADLLQKNQYFKHIINLGQTINSKYFQLQA